MNDALAAPPLGLDEPAERTLETSTQDTDMQEMRKSRETAILHADLARTQVHSEREKQSAVQAQEDAVAEGKAAEAMAEAEDDARRDVYELERIIQAEEAKLMMMAPDSPKMPPLDTVQLAMDQFGAVMLPAHNPMQPGLARVCKSALEFGAELDNEVVRRSLAECKRTLDSTSKRVDEVEQATSQTEAALDKMHEDINEYTDMLNTFKPSDLSESYRAQTLLGESEANRRRQLQVHDELDDETDAVQRAHYSAVLEMAHAQQLEKVVDATSKMAHAKHVQIAKHRHRSEVKAVEAYQRSRVDAKVEAYQKAQQEEEEDRHALELARDGHRRAVKRLQGYMTDIKHKMVAMEEGRQAALMSRADALLNLKHSIDAARNACMGQVARKAKRDAVRAEKEAIEFRNLIAAGENPYLIFRKREEEARRAAAEQALVKEQNERNVELAKKIIKEDKAYDKEVERKRLERAQLDKFAEEMSVTRERKTEAYMLSKTKTGVDMMDPTSRMPWFPSQATLIKNWKFGTGRAEPEVLEMMQRKYMQLPQPLLISREHAKDFAKNGPIRSQPPPVFALGGASEDKEEEGEQERDGGAHSPPRASGGSGGPADAKSAAGSKAAAEAQQEDDDEDDEALGELEGPPTTEEGDTDALAEDSKTIPVRELSVFEKNMMKEALQRQKDNIVKTQVVWGKEFEGHAFLAKPKVLMFKDFVVGKVYTKKVVLTNVSYTFNTFKVLAVEDEYKDFFDVAFTFPGPMSAGMTCTLTVTFDPRLNQDIDTHIPCIAETGPFVIPLKARIKRRVISVHPNSGVYFGQVTLAESRQAVLTLVNDGALRADFTVDVLASPNGTDEEPSGPFTHPTGGRVEGYSQTDLQFGFHPLQEGVASLDLVLKFATDDVPDMFLRLEGVGGQVPIVVERETYDLQTCIYGRTYREKIVVHNRGKTALKCSMKPRSSMADYLVFNPELLYCQGGSSSYFNVTFKPTSDMLQLIGRKYADPESGVMEVPLRVVVPDQVLPVNVTLRATLTSSLLEFEPPSLDFMQCPLAESVLAPLRVTNTSKLTQKFGFVNLPKEIEIRPQKGFGTLLPGETADLTVVWSPLYVGTQEANLTCRSLLVNHTYQVPYVAKAYKAPLSFNLNTIKMPCTAWHNTSTVSVEVTNTSKQTQTFELAPPLDSFLTISPLVTTLLPGRVQRVQINFTPKLPKPEPPPPPAALETGEDGARGDATEEGPGPGGKAPGSRKNTPADKDRPSSKQQKEKDKKGKKGKKDPEPDPEPEPELKPEPLVDDDEWVDAEEFNGDPLDFCQNSIVRVPCFIKDTDFTMYIEVDTTVVEAKLSCNPIKDPKAPIVARPRIPASGRYHLAFQQVPVGKKEVKKITLRNIASNETADVQMAPFDHAGIFTVVNARRSIPPRDGTHTLTVQFAPQWEGRFEADAVLRCEMGPVTVHLSGQGISPCMILDPAVTELDMQDTYMNEPVEHTLMMRNTSPFELPFKCLLQDLNVPNLSGTLPFSVHPQHGVVPPGEAQELVVTFCADHEPVFGIKNMFTEFLRIQVPNQKEDLLVKLVARCWERGMYLVGAVENPAQSDPYMVSASRNFVKRRDKKADNDDNHVSVVINFDDEVECGGKASKTIQIGNVMSGGLAAAGDFAVEALSKEKLDLGWVISTGDGKGLNMAVPAGERKDLVLEFNPPELPSPIALANFGLGEWYEVTTTLTLKGGGQPPKAKETKGSDPQVGPTGLCGNTVVKLSARCYLRGLQD